MSLNKNGEDHKYPEKHNNAVPPNLTKYELHSRSKIVMAVKAISLALIFSNSGFSDSLWGKELGVVKP